ncbi:MAG: 4-hydroxybenzoate octaprenyltransferase [Betaproteobacteria bacterium]|nr:4-hydroxybenzoate octaprenyltransferase [Betaproteobacteria bacterium]
MHAPTPRWLLYLRLIRLDKPIGILLLLWPTLWGLWIAGEGKPDPLILAVFIAGTVLMRSAGCAINDWADRDFDAHVKRTAARPLAAGQIAPREALIVAAVLALAAFLLVLLFLNRLTLWLSVPAVLIAASYPFTKRFFALPQAYLGLAFGFGIPMAFAAETGAVPPLAWALLAANAFWTLAYDTEYAMVDRQDDMKIGIQTSALLFGRHDVAMVMFCYTVMLALLTLIGKSIGLGWPYFIGVGIACALALYHYTLIRRRAPDACFKAFLHNNWVGLAVFCGLFLDYALRNAAPA